jgi:hypothetical protein
VIADLSANHVERHVLHCGFAVERVYHDYGVDLVMFTYRHSGEVEAGQVLIQLKATDRLKLQSDGRVVAFRVERGDVEVWREEMVPVILVVYDARTDVAYWLHVQGDLERSRVGARKKSPAAMTVHVPRDNVVNGDAVRAWAGLKAAVLARWQEVTREE